MSVDSEHKQYEDIKHKFASCQQNKLGFNLKDFLQQQVKGISEQEGANKDGFDSGYQWRGDL